MTVQERVCASNIEEMTTRVRNGPDNIHGAETVVTNDGVVIQLECCKERSSIRLQYGWIVERFLKNVADDPPGMYHPAGARKCSADAPPDRLRRTTS